MSTPILKIALLVFAAVVVVVFAMNIPFVAIDKDSIWASFSIWITESGGKYGTGLILLVTCIFYTRFIDGAQNKLITFSSTLFKLLIVIGLFAYLNEHLIKLALKQPRPSHSFIVSHSNGSLNLDSLYTHENSGRHELLKSTIANNPTQFNNIHPHILSHWTEETGYSFPSGHSFNGFLLAYILCFSLFNSRSETGKRLYFLPLIWAALVAISRVALGAHTAWDISFGGLTGILVAFLLMHFNLLRDNLLHRKYARTL